MGMAGRHLKDLIAAYGSRDDLMFRRAAQALIVEEEAKKHTALARDLKRLLSANNTSAVLNEEPVFPEPPMDRDSGTALATVTYPRRTFGELILHDHVADLFQQYGEEVKLWPVLDAAGVPRRNRILLYGPPGCGKTSTVEALANSLNRPLVTARVDGLMSSYLGETASNLRKLFDYASSDSYVLLLDEFDSLGKVRNDPSDHGELRRVVNAVLQQIDSYSGPSIIVAATNHPDVLDAALWRRFDVVAEMGLPDQHQIQSIIFNIVGGRGELFGLPAIASRLVGLPHVAAEFTAYSALRRSLLQGNSMVHDSDLSQAVDEATVRRWV